MPEYIIRPKAINQLKIVGVLGYDKYLDLVEEAINSIAVLLGDKTYLMGEKITLFYCSFVG
jgi:hypothetical protein